MVRTHSFVFFGLWSICFIGLVLCQSGVFTFHQQLLNAKVNLTKSLIQRAKTKRETNSLNVKWNHLWIESIESSNSALMQYGNDKVFILSKDTEINLNGPIETFKLIPIVNLQGISDQISFIESIEWKNILFLLLGLNNGQCQLMTATNKLDFTMRQKISTVDNPVDAEFFVLNDQLFIIIIFNEMDDKKATTRIYRWRNTHLDEEPATHIKTVGAISVATFTYEESVMLIICQKQVSSQVLKMKSNGVIEKIQFLPTKDPVSIKHFTMENENFIMILEKNEASTIYWWEGKEFVEWLSLPKIYGDFTLSVGYVRGNTFILCYKENFVTVYSMNWRELHKVVMKGFAGEVVNAALYINERIYLVVILRTNILKVESIEITIDSKDTNAENHPLNSPQKSDRIVQCVKELENSVTMVEDKLRLLKQTLPNILFDDKPANITGNIKVLGPSSTVNIETGKIEEVLLQNNNMTKKSQTISEIISDVSDKITILRNNLKQKITSPRSKTLILNSNLIIKNANINEVKTTIVNNAEFEPEKFISLSNNQRLKADLFAQNLNVGWLLVELIGGKNTQSLAPKDNTIHSPQTLSSLHCDKMEILKLPLINGVNISNLVTSQMNITLKGHTVLEDLIVDDLKAAAVNEEENIKNLLDTARTKTFENLRLPDNTYIENINVGEINKVNIENLINNMALIGQNNTINGDLYFRHGFLTNELITRKLNAGLIPKNFEYPTNEVFKGRETVRQKRDLTKRRLVIYKGKVKVKGDLNVNKLFLDNTVLHVKNHSNDAITMKEFNHIFWTKHSNQNISVPVKFSNGAQVQGDLEIGNINDYDLSDFTNNTDIFSHVRMWETSVTQLLTSENPRTSKIPDLKELNKLIVRKEGVYHVTGKKVFQNKLEIKRLKTQEINEIPAQKAFIFMDFSRWENMIISNLSVKGNVNTNMLNNISLGDIILSHKDYNLTSTEFRNLTGNDVSVTILNDMEFNKLIEMLKLTGDGKKLQINFNGNLKVPAILSTRTVNGKTLQDILPLVVNGSNPSKIFGKKFFKSQFVVENDLSMSTLNGEVLQRVFDSRLSKSNQQNITGFYTMETSKLESLSTEVINAIRFDDLVFIDDPIIMIRSDVRMQELRATAATILDGCDLPTIAGSLIFPNEVNWSSLQVDDDVQWKINSPKGIQKLIDYAMIDDKNQTITGNVIFNSLKADHFETAFVNNFNIQFILDDAVMKNTSNQVVFGHKKFAQKVFCSQCKTLQDATILSINKINISDLKTKIVTYNTDNVIRGHKIFRNGFKSFKFTCEGGVNGVKSKDIVTETTKNRQPFAVFNSLEITEDLNIGTINGINLNEFIQSIVMLKSEYSQTVKAQIVFNKGVELTGKSTIKSINSMDIGDTLSTHNFINQNINGCTNLTAYTVIKGNFNVDKINGKIFNETYESSILNNRNYSIQGNIIFHSGQSVNTIYGKQYFSDEMEITHFNQSFENKCREKSNEF